MTSKRWVLQRETEEGIVLTYCTNGLWQRKDADAVRFEREIDGEAMKDFFPEDVKVVRI